MGAGRVAGYLQLGSRPGKKDGITEQKAGPVQRKAGCQSELAGTREEE